MDLKTFDFTSDLDTMRGRIKERDAIDAGATFDCTRPGRFHRIPVGRNHSKTRDHDSTHRLHPPSNFMLVLGA